MFGINYDYVLDTKIIIICEFWALISIEINKKKQYSLDQGAEKKKQKPLKMESPWRGYLNYSPLFINFFKWNIILQNEEINN